jgi:DNA-binding beta-propeller fold protein YncE
MALLAEWTVRPASAQDQAFTRDIAARARIFPEIGPGASALKRDAAGRYYVLAAPANAVVIYGADGNRIGQIPNANSRGAKIVYASDIDVDAEGRLFVADRGANAVRVFDTAGSLIATARVPSPLSVAALSGGEFAATMLRSEQLVSIFDARGAVARTFGDIPAPSRGQDQGALLSPGRLYGDGKGHIYFVFTELPDPTIRKYDRFGYAAFEISLPASEFAPAREARQWTTVTIGKNAAPPSKPVIRALAVDPETQEVWAAIGDELLHFDKDGNRRAAYHTTTKTGARIEAAAILVEHDRILIADDPNGIFDFAYPEPRHATSVPR